MEALLEIFDKIAGCLEQLSDLARKKIDAVKKDDLLALDDALRHEQAIALTIRGLDHKRTELLDKLGLKDVPLVDLPKKAPDELKLKTKDCVERLREQYKMYISSAGSARNVLESNLYEIEKFLASKGVQNLRGPGYREQDMEPPKAMKTDFHV